MHVPTEFASFRHGMTTEISTSSVAGALSMTAEAPAFLLASDFDLLGMAMKSCCPRVFFLHFRPIYGPNSWLSSRCTHKGTLRGFGRPSLVCLRRGFGV